MGITPIPADTADRIRREVLADCGGVEWDGAKALQPIVVAGQILDLAHQVVHAIPEGTPLLRDWWQTIFCVVLPGTAPLDPTSLLAVTAHEDCHVLQWWKIGPRMVGEYLANPEQRGGKYEIDGFAAGIAVRLAITGEVPTLDDATYALAHGYVLSADDVALVRGELEQALTSLVRGIVPPGPARRTIARLAAENPDYLDAAWLAKARVACPELFTGALE